MIAGELNRNFAWDGERLWTGGEPPARLRGAAATVEAGRVVRDPLGLNKLFWCARPDGELDFASTPAALIALGHTLDDVVAVPPGTGVGRPDEWWAAPPEELDLDAAGREIRAVLDRYLAAVAARHPAAPVYVCLSGGLDSTGIALLVAEHFPGAVAVSFDLGRDSEDRRTAIRLAAELGLPLLEATVIPEVLLESLDTVLREGIDWRDFNVHAGLVNAALAAAIAAAAPTGEPPLVFTGDLANEFLVDYAEERYRGDAYYSLPRIGPRALRSFLVKGLDTSHREIGVFEASGLAVVQPYAVAVDTYMRLPDAFLALDDRKERLCRAIFGPAVPEYVLTRPKARAQVGGTDQAGGVLAACVDRGVDAGALRRRFAELHGVTDDRALDRFIRAGRYRARVPATGGALSERT